MTMYQPLTEQDLLVLSSNKNEMLERYIHQLSTPKAPKAAPPPSTQHHHQNSDYVVASPRFLLFPYHNDAMFLPTAEQTQYRKSSFGNDTTSFSGTSGVHSSSSTIPPSPSFMSGTQRAHSTNTTGKMRGCSGSRRSLPARLDSFVSKHKILGRSTSTTTTTTTTSGSSFGSSVSSLDMADNNSDTKKPWLKRVLKFFNKQQKHHHHDGNPVWYCQYKNPTK